LNPHRTGISILVGLLLTATALQPASAGSILSPPEVLLCEEDSATFSQISTPGQYGVRDAQNVTLTSSFDGENIDMAVVRPDVPEGTRVPVIVVASPYLNYRLSSVNARRCDPRLVYNFVPQGYAVGFVNVRGYAGSGGCSDLHGPAEKSDLNQAITWFGTQPWSNGRVGMIGVSYDGSTAWEVASTGNPYLKTIIPISGVSDFYHLMYRNGSNELRGALVLNALYYGLPFLPILTGGARSTEDYVSTVVCPEAFAGFAAAAHSTLTGERDPTGWWAERNQRPGVEQNYHGSIFIARGLQDWNVDPAHDFPWVWELEKKGIYVKYFLHQGGHNYPDAGAAEGGSPRWGFADILLNWFEYWLKGDTTRDLGPKVEVSDSSGQWRSAGAWPPANAVKQDLHLTASNELVSVPSAQAGSFLVHPDQNVTAIEGNDCTDACALFSTQPFASDFRFAGIPRVNLQVTPTGPGGHLNAWLYSGQSTPTKRLGWGQVDLRFAQGGETMSPVVPGTPIPLRLDIEPLDAVVPAGERLFLVIGQRTYGDHLPSVPTYPVNVNVGAGTGSRLTVDTFTVDPAAFFVDETPVPPVFTVPS
jgi:X-Pro dipeptidyl-peptidase